MYVKGGKNLYRLIIFYHVGLSKNNLIDVYKIIRIRMAFNRIVLSTMKRWPNTISLSQCIASVKKATKFVSPGDVYQNILKCTLGPTHVKSKKK